MVTVGEAVMVDVVVFMGVDDALANGSMVFVMVGVNEFVGVKKSTANACWVRARSRGVDVGVYFGSRTISSRRSGPSPAIRRGNPKANRQVPIMTSRTMEPCAFILLFFFLPIARGI